GMEGDMALSEDPAKTAMAITMSGEALPAGQGMEMRLVDQIMYMKMGEMTQGKFVKIDLTDESNPLGEQYGNMLDQSNPATQIEAMGKSIVKFENQGDGGEIDGVSTTKYLVQLDTAKMYEAQGVDPS